MKTILIYESTHHGNTKKLVDAVAKRYGIRTATVEEAATMDLSAYDRIGIASGVAFGKVYEATERFMDNSLPRKPEPGAAGCLESMDAAALTPSGRSS